MVYKPYNLIGPALMNTLMSEPATKSFFPLKAFELQRVVRARRVYRLGTVQRRGNSSATRCLQEKQRTPIISRQVDSDAPLVPSPARRLLFRWPHVREFGQGWIQMIPGVPAGCEHHKLRFEAGWIIQRANIDAEHVGLGYRLIVKRRAARPAEPF